MTPQCFSMVFSGDKVTIAATREGFIHQFEAKRKVPAGEYTIVMCVIRTMAGSRIGVVDVLAAQATLTGEVERPILYVELLKCQGFFQAGDEEDDRHHRMVSDNFRQLTASDYAAQKQAISLRKVDPRNLTSVQRSETISGLVKEYHYWWDNAERKVKAILTEIFSVSDQARETFHRALEMANCQRHKDAITETEKALAMDPTLIGARLELGKLCLRIRDLDASTKWFLRELEEAKEPLALDAHCYLAAIYNELGAANLAEKHAQAASTIMVQRGTSWSFSTEELSSIRVAVAATRAGSDRTEKPPVSAAVSATGKTPPVVNQEKGTSSAKQKSFANWDYQTVQELDGLCKTLPILPTDRAKAFFKEVNRVTGSDAKVVDRQAGKLFEGMMGFVGASDRKDFSASWEDGKPETSGYGIMVVQTFDKSIGVTFCLARISKDTFLTCGWIGEEKRQALKSLLSKQCG